MEGHSLGQTSFRWSSCSSQTILERLHQGPYKRHCLFQRDMLDRVDEVPGIPRDMDYWEQTWSVEDGGASVQLTI